METIVIAKLPPRTASLTPRQTDVARLVARGMTNAQIAEHLGLSRNTIDSYVQRILTRLWLRNRRELASYALKELS